MTHRMFMYYQAICSCGWEGDPAELETFAEEEHDDHRHEEEDK